MAKVLSVGVNTRRQMVANGGKWWHGVAKVLSELIILCNSFKFTLAETKYEHRDTRTWLLGTKIQFHIAPLLAVAGYPFTTLRN